jgi:cellobiose phosphorylase
MRYGYFDDQNQEYVITQPDTPLPWINYLGCENFFGLISNTAGGYSFYRDARLRRVTRYRYNQVPLDQTGRFIYLRDNNRGIFWSPTWQPTQDDLDYYECRHGLGYTKITSQKKGINATIRYFIPIGENLEIWELELTNYSKKEVDLTVFPYIEFCLWDAFDDMTNFQRNFNTGEVEVQDHIIFHKTEYRERRNHFAYLASSASVSGFDTQRQDFLGAYRSVANPEAVERGYCKNSIAHGWAPIAAQEIKTPLYPGETRKIIFLLGYFENPNDEKFEPANDLVINKNYVLPIITHYLNHINVEDAFNQLHLYWNKLLDKFQVTTPDLHTNRMVNIWNAYQCMVTFNLSRSASYFESGIGRGMGFRDSNQDLLGFVHMIPESARSRILDLAATQLETGGAFHQYQPMTKRGNDDIGSNFNDDPLWLVLAVASYLKESGDWSILEELIPFENIIGSEATLYNHLRRSIDYVLNRLGPHGLPLIGRADWNDCLNLNAFTEKPGESFQTTTNKEGKVAESVFIAGLFVIAVKEMIAISSITNRVIDELRYQKLVQEMKEIVLQFGWDGNWFLRAYDNNGEAIGSNQCAEGKIFIEPQGICIMAGIGIEDGKAEKALSSVREHLSTPHGILLLQPAYSQYYLNLGEISSYPPGYKENAGIFCHTNPWIMIAATRFGDGDIAFDYYLRINPSNREEISQIHRCEPYVYAQMMAGRDAPSFGEAKNSWLTGTAAWNYVAITQAILGIQPDYDGLRISPVIPKDWDGFKAKRIFRGITYDISVKRIGTGNKTEITADGRKIRGNQLPIITNKKEPIIVEVLLS